MPELPEVETTRLGILPLVGETVADVVIRNGSLRWPIPQSLPEMLAHQRLNALTRRAKYILAHFDTGVLLLHLGMSGRLSLLAQNEAPQKHDHFDIIFKNGQVLRLRDPRRFGAVLWAGTDPAKHMLLSKLGPEPLDDVFTGQYLYQHLRTRSVAIKTAIMDSHLVVGVGNIYASESLFRARIHPEASAKTLSLTACDRLADEIKSTLREALAAGGSSLRDFFGADGKPGYFQQEYFVYARTNQPCKVCAQSIKSIRLGQRSTFFCEHCQKR
ncbi:formamidopyrimidine-DNA glycosylase [mine drainage metagenome]|uniref:Formamidopyrimidine-DNA glycosylase n=1 Tax=mine drainage metagenome TaxID=410659 RepID=A0A1J5R587_9ZZZZ